MQTSSFQKRLLEAMSESNMTSADLVKKTGLSKQKISNYVKGKFKAKQDGLYLLAKALDVSEAWLMGYDVSKERLTATIRNMSLSQEEEQLLNDFRLLNKAGKEYIRQTMITAISSNIYERSDNFTKLENVG